MKTSRYWLSGALLALGLLMALLMLAGSAVDAAPNVCATPIPTTWRITGNCGTTAGTNFLGTTDSIALVFKTNNVEQMRILPNGRVGIGTTSPSQKLDVAGNVRVYPTTGNGLLALRNRSNANYSQVVFYDDVGTYRGYLGYIGANAGLGSRNDTVELGTFQKALTFRPNETEAMRITLNGRVGIGTASPVQKLHVYGGNSRLRLQSTQSDKWTVTEYKTDAREWHTGVGGSTVTNGVANKYYIWDQSAGAFRLVIDQFGAVSIGTMEVKGLVTVEGQAGIALYAKTTRGNLGVYGEGPTVGVEGFATNGDGVYGKSNSGNKDDAGVSGHNHACGAGQGCYGVYSDGNFAVAPGYTKSALVHTTKFGERKLYSMESPENWFEDFGFGQLVNGRAVISIDPVFAQTVNLSEPYHVFLTPRDGFAELYVTSLTPTTFEVRDARGTANLQFDYRIIAKRLGMEDLRLTPDESLPTTVSAPSLSRSK